MMSSIRKHSLQSLLVVVVLFLGSAAEAATYVVSNNNDSGVGSLRQLMTDANNTVENDTIIFGGNYTIPLGAELPSIVSSGGAMTVDATGMSITVSGNNSVGIFNVGQNAILTIKHLVVANGKKISGGGLFSDHGVVTVIDSLFLGNEAFNSISGCGCGGGINNDGGTLTISNSRFSDNFASYGGGGVFNSGTAVVSNSEFSTNSVGQAGGGIYNGWWAGVLTVINTTFKDNAAVTYGAGIYNGISATVSGSTFSGNSAGRDGGGLYNYTNGVVSNSTFSNNSAAGTGGGISNGSDVVPPIAASITITNSTLSGNGSISGGGGIYNNGQATVNNTLIANSSTGGDCFGVNPIGSTNLFEDGTCGFSAGGDPLLGPLADNGGPTQTMALLTGSPAIDRGDNAICAASPVNDLDQRGVIRPQGSQCDIGAFELSRSTPLPNPIPTLSEWAKIMMILMMIATASWYGRRMKQR